MKFVKRYCSVCNILLTQKIVNGKRQFFCNNKECSDRSISYTEYSFLSKDHNLDITNHPPISKPKIAQKKLYCEDCGSLLSHGAHLNGKPTYFCTGIECGARFKTVYVGASPPPETSPN